MSRCEGLLYRALNPRWAAEPLSGAGAALHGGRFNARGQPVLHCSLSPVTAMREAMRREGRAPTQAFAARMAKAGWQALRVPSFAPGAQGQDINIVVLRWTAPGSARLHRHHASAAIARQPT